MQSSGVRSRSSTSMSAVKTSTGLGVKRGDYQCEHYLFHRSLFSFGLECSCRAISAWVRAARRTLVICLRRAILELRIMISSPSVSFTSTHARAAATDGRPRRGRAGRGGSLSTQTASPTSGWGNFDVRSPPYAQCACPAGKTERHRADHASSSPIVKLALISRNVVMAWSPLGYGRWSGRAASAARLSCASGATCTSSTTLRYRKGLDIRSLLDHISRRGGRMAEPSSG